MAVLDTFVFSLMGRALRWLSPFLPPIVRIVVQAGALHQEGKDQELLDMIEADASLKAELYADPERLAIALRARLATEDRDWAALYICTLAGALTFLGRRQDGLAVFAADLGLDVRDFPDPQTLAGRLQERLRGVLPDWAMGYRMGIVGLLGMNELHAEAAALLEAEMGLDPEVYQDRERLAWALRRRVEGLEPDMAFSYVFMLASVFGVVGREQEALRIFEAHLGIEEADDQDLSRLVAKVTAALEGLQDNIARAYTAMLAILLGSSGREAAMLALVEANLELKPEDYRDGERLVAWWLALRGTLMPEIASVFLFLQAAALFTQDRHDDALALFAVDLGLDFERAEPGQVVAALQERFGDLSPTLRGTYTRTLVQTLFLASSPQEALAVLEAWAGLEPAVYQDPELLTRRLDTWLSGMTDGSGAASIYELVSTLLSLGEEERAAAVVGTYVELFVHLEDLSGQEHALIPHLCPLLDIWLGHHGSDGERRPVEVCRALVRYLRKSLAERGVSLQDRQEFITYTGHLRRRVVETGYLWAERERDPDRAAALRCEVQLWDAELSQRSLIERFLLEPIVEVPSGDLPLEDWPWVEDEPRRKDHLPDPALAKLSRGELGEKADGLLGVQGVRRPGHTRLAAASPALYQRAQQIIRSGVGRRWLARAIGADALLIRATFTPQGRLLWTGLRSDGEDVEVVAHGAGLNGDLDHLRWVAARHDFRMGALRQATKAAGADVLEDARRALDEVVALLAGDPVDGLPSAEALSEQLAGVITRALERKHREPLTRLLFPAWTLLQTLPAGAALLPWAERSAERLRVLRSDLAAAPVRLQEDLDQVTREYLDEVARIWDLEPLAGVLSPDLDVVLQVEDALHTVPVAHLPVAGEPLFRRVRSLRSSLALLMTTLQEESEKDVRERWLNARRLLSVSHFASSDRARDGVLWLQHGFSVLGQRYGLKALAAADVPPASVGLLRAALESYRSFRVLAICGHGDLLDSGIELAAHGRGTRPAGILWRGEGCDLTGVDWLWMVSCSIGRLSQNGDRDVEGFCVQLAVQRARSVAAFRWPVDSLQAVALTNEAVRCYLEATAGEEEGPAQAEARCLRARALNDARKAFLGDGTQPSANPLVGLNTAAACELFGLG